MIKALPVGLLALVVAGCDTMPVKPPIPDSEGTVAIPNITPVAQLPVFKKEINEVEIADSMNAVDPTWVLGAIVNVNTGQVHGLDSYLTGDAKPVVTPQTEVVFRDFVENDLTTKAGWLDFLKAEVSDNVRAEVSVVRSSKATIRNSDVDIQRLRNSVGLSIPAADRKNYGVIIGYLDFLLNAGLFKSAGVEASTSGYGAKIGGKWYSKAENTAAQHRIIAIWAPLPFVLERLSGSPASPVTLEVATQDAIREGTVEVKSLDRAQIEDN